MFIVFLEESRRDCLDLDTWHTYQLDLGWLSEGMVQTCRLDSNQERILLICQLEPQMVQARYTYSDSNIYNSSSHPFRWEGQNVHILFWSRTSAISILLDLHWIWLFHLFVCLIVCLFVCLIDCLFVDENLLLICPKLRRTICLQKISSALPFHCKLVWLVTLKHSESISIHITASYAYESKQYFYWIDKWISLTIASNHLIQPL